MVVPIAVCPIQTTLLPAFCEDVGVEGNTPSAGLVYDYVSESPSLRGMMGAEVTIRPTSVLAALI
jgi:hypothetical protein